MVLWTRSLKGCGASKRLLEGAREVFWRPSGSLLEPCGGSLGLLGGILGALSPKKPPRIPKEGPKSSPRRPQEALRGPRRPPKGSQETPKKAQEATKAPPKPHTKKNRKTLKMMTLCRKINDFEGPKAPQMSPNQANKIEN
jgi:hypothetical protein